jgi:hypothetical protein
MPAWDSGLISASLFSELMAVCPFMIPVSWNPAGG